MQPLYHAFDFLFLFYCLSCYPSLIQRKTVSVGVLFFYFCWLLFHSLNLLMILIRDKVDSIERLQQHFGSNHNKLFVSPKSSLYLPTTFEGLNEFSSLPIKKQKMGVGFFLRLLWDNYCKRCFSWDNLNFIRKSISIFGLESCFNFIIFKIPVCN